ncbi:hypothetical protein [Paraburkholderia caffeinilytica]|uniref:hypothetical protein n=1 Tax=Paraburkholderia caffeinilytica TaxID=1761016 RepID=UPI0038BB98DE
MPRPYFLQRLSGRTLRRIHGIDREPVCPDRYDDLRICALIFLSGAGLAALILVGLFGDRVFTLICGV